MNAIYHAAIGFESREWLVLVLCESGISENAIELVAVYAAGTITSTYTSIVDCVCSLSSSPYELHVYVLRTNA